MNGASRLFSRFTHDRVTEDFTAVGPVTHRQTLSNTAIVRVLFLWVIWSLLYAMNGGYVGPFVLMVWGLVVILSVLACFWRPKITLSAAMWTALPLISLCWILFADPGSPHWPVGLGLAVCVAALFAAAARGFLRVIGLVLVFALATACVVAAWHWGHDNIDVFTMTQTGSLDVLRGVNPYQSWFPSTTLGVARLRYDYGPALLILAAPFAALGDVRLLSVVSGLGILTLAGWRFGWRCETTWIGLALLVASPWLGWVILQSWTELPAMALLLAWYATQENWRWSWLFLAAALSINPDVAVLMVPIAIVIPRLRRGVGYAVALSLLAWFGTYLFSGHDLIQAFEVASGLRYDPTISIGGLYKLFWGMDLPKVSTVLVAIWAWTWLWFHRPVSPLGRELAVAVAGVTVVWFLPFVYFEYASILGVWIWWVFASEMSRRSAPHEMAERC